MARLNLTKRYGDQRDMGPGVLWEVDMATLFSIAFTGIFLAFITAAILGHVLLVQAYVRPFLGKLAVAPQLNKSTLAPAR